MAYEQIPLNNNQSISESQHPSQIEQAISCYELRSAEPLHVLQLDGSVVIVESSPKEIQTRSNVLRSLLQEKRLAPPNPLYDTARGVLAELAVSALLQETVTAGNSETFCVMQAPVLCNIPRKDVNVSISELGTEKSGDVVLLRQSQRGDGKIVSLPVVLFEVKASQRNSQVHKGINSRLGREVPVVTLCFDVEGVLASGIPVQEQLRHLLEGNWVDRLPDSVREESMLDARYAVTKAVEDYLDFLQTLRKGETVQNFTHLVKHGQKVAGIDVNEYLQRKMQLRTLD